MKYPIREYLLRMAALIGLGMSVLLIAEYRDPLPALCAPGGGCDVVRNSEYSHILGIPLPILGMLFFAAALAIPVVPRLRRIFLLPLSAVALGAGLLFVGIQAFSLHAFCPLCLVVDAAALVLGGLGLSLRGVPARQPSFLSAALNVAAAVAVSVAAVVWHARLPVPAEFTTGEMPAVVKQEQAPDRVTVVEFVDFQCPACRAQYAEFKSVLNHYQGRVHVVMKNVPLPQHEHAIDAARAFCCADENGEAHAMADRLFLADTLTPEDCEEIAVSLGLDREEFRRCVRSQWVEDRLRADQDAAITVGIHSLPTFWIGNERFEGVHESDALRSSIERALRRSARS